MELLPLAAVESWHTAVNARDFEQLCAIASSDVELVGSRGSARGYEVLRQWLGLAGFTAEPLRWFCGGSAVVVEQRGRWVIPETSSERVVASVFRVVRGRVVRYQRFEDLGDALAQAALTSDDEIIMA